MSFVIVTFFASLFAIIYMIGRKLFLLKEAGETVVKEEIMLIAPNLESIKHLATKKFKQYGYIVILMSLRMSVKSSNYVRRAWEEMWKRIEGKLKGDKEAEQKEISKFLKTVSDYKQKLKNIKDRIREEERLK